VFGVGLVFSPELTTSDVTGSRDALPPPESLSVDRLGREYLKWSVMGGS
jgi:hypothetical protein